MDADRSGSRRERSEERYQADSPVRESTEGAFGDSDEYDKDRSRESSKHRSKDKKKSRREDKDYRIRDKDRSKAKDEFKEREVKEDSEKERIFTKEKRKEDREEHEKDRAKDKRREKDHDKDKHRGKDHDRDRDEKDRGRKKDRERERDSELESNRGREKEKSKEKEEREKEKAKDRDRGKDKERTKEKERTRDRERDHEKNKDRDLLDREQIKDINREKESEIDREKERSRDKEKVGRRSREDQHQSKDGGRDTKAKKDGDDDREKDTSELGNASLDEEGTDLVKQGSYVEDSSVVPNQSRTEVVDRILRMKDERLRKKPEGASEILSWVNRSRKIEEKRNSEKTKALRRSKIFEEQDNLNEDINEFSKETADALAGVKVLHGIDKVLEGGAVVLTLKDQDILANGDVNEDVDMLENVEIGEQKRRSEAYQAAKKSTGIYDDKFNDVPGEEKKMLPQYDDHAEEGVVLDAAGRFTGEAEKKLEELRRRLQGPSMINQAEDLTSSVRTSSDFYTPEEMLQFRKPKKKKSLRKKEKFDLDALEAEARSTGLGSTDLGSRSDTKRQAAREEEERSEAERRKTAYQTAFAKADEASKALRLEQAVTLPKEENDTLAFADDAEDLQLSLERARKLALKKQNVKVLSVSEAVARLASSVIKNKPTDAENSVPDDASDNKVVFTEMEEFVWGLQLDEEDQKPNHEDVFMEEDEAPRASEEMKDDSGGWAEVVESGKDEQPMTEDTEDVVPDKTLHEVPVGKGLSGALQLLKDRGTLKETIEWGGRNMDKKKSKLVGIYDEDGPKEIHMDKKKGKLVGASDDAYKEIHLERTDEFGRILTPKQAFRLLSHKFHGKGPGKMKQEKRMKQYYDELKLKQMTSSDLLPQSVERMRDAQAQLKTPYLVLSGNVKPGQTSDPRSGFATVDKEVPGSLTPMLGDRKVEHFLGIKRKAEPGSSGTPKKPKT